MHYNNNSNNFYIQVSNNSASTEAGFTPQDAAWSSQQLDLTIRGPEKNED